MSSKDYYHILGLGRDASAEQIKKAYRKRAMQYHPDRNHGKEEWANAKFKEINEAFSVLGDSDKRRQYDRFGTAGNVGDIFGTQATRTTFEDLMKDFGASGLGFGFLDDVFEDTLGGRGFSFDAFGRGFGGSEGARFETHTGINLADLLRQPQHENKAKYEIISTNEQAAKGIEKDLARKGKRLRVRIPAGVKTGSQVRLRNALSITDGRPGDIVIDVKLK